MKTILFDTTQHKAEEISTLTAQLSYSTLTEQSPKKSENHNVNDNPNSNYENTTVMKSQDHGPSEPQAQIVVNNKESEISFCY